MPGYGEREARSGLNQKMPEIDCWPNQFPGYEITIVHPEYTSVCPKTGLPDFGTITIRYMPNKKCVELKSLKEYFLAYRNLGIFYENATNKILRDFVAACKPRWVIIRGDFSSRGGIHASIEARFPKNLRLPSEKDAR